VDHFSSSPLVQLKGTMFLLEAVPIGDVKRVFPNLETLYFTAGVGQCSNEAALYLASFCAEFPQLEHLELPGVFWTFPPEAYARIQPDFSCLATAISQLPNLRSLSLLTFPFTEAQVRVIVTGLARLQHFEAPGFSDPGTFLRLAQMPELILLEIAFSQSPAVLNLCQDPVHFPALVRLTLWVGEPAAEALESDQALQFADLKRELALSRPTIVVM